MLLSVARTETEKRAMAIAVAMGTTRLDRSAAGEVLTLQRAAWVSEGRENHTFDIPPLTEGLDDVVASLSDPAMWFWGYRDATHRLLGMVRTSPTATAGTSFLGRLGVTPDLVGTGLGSALLTLAEARQPAGITRMELITGARSAGNHRFYAAHGWTPDRGVAAPENTVAFSKRRAIGPGRGMGPGTITADGCAVELYARLPAQGEPELIAALLEPGASILELGCGTGRIADPLAEAGFEVIGVDNSPEMLAHMSHASGVLSPIIGFDAGRRFDAVIAASHLISSADDGFRAGLLETVRRHLAPGGVAVFQWHTPAWHDELAVGNMASGRMRAVASSLLITNAGTGWTCATAGYELGEDRWVHEFVAPRISESELMSTLAEHGLVFGSWLKDNHSWFTAHPGEQRHDYLVPSRREP